MQEEQKRATHEVGAQKGRLMSSPTMIDLIRSARKGGDAELTTLVSRVQSSPWGRLTDALFITDRAETIGGRRVKTLHLQRRPVLRLVLDGENVRAVTLFSANEAETSYQRVREANREYARRYAAARTAVIRAIRSGAGASFQNGQEGGVFLSPSNLTVGAAGVLRSLDIEDAHGILSRSGDLTSAGVMRAIQSVTSSEEAAILAIPARFASRLPAEALAGY